MCHPFIFISVTHIVIEIFYINNPCFARWNISGYNPSRNGLHFGSLTNKFLYIVHKTETQGKKGPVDIKGG